MDAEESFKVECSDEEIQKELKNGVFSKSNFNESKVKVILPFQIFHDMMLIYLVFG